MDPRAEAENPWNRDRHADSTLKGSDHFTLSPRHIACRMERYVSSGMSGTHPENSHVCDDLPDEAYKPASGS